MGEGGGSLSLSVTQENLSRSRERVKAEQGLWGREVRKAGVSYAMSQPRLKKESKRLPQGTSGVK